MDLIPWRHAEAEVGEPDYGRDLTGKGRKQAAKVGHWLTYRVKDDTAHTVLRAVMGPDFV